MIQFLQFLQHQWWLRSPWKKKRLRSQKQLLKRRSSALMQKIYQERMIQFQRRLLKKSKLKVKMVREAAVDVEEVETEEPIEVSIEAVENTEGTEESIEEEEVTADVVVIGKIATKMMKASKLSKSMATRTIGEEDVVAEAEEEAIEVREEHGEVVKVVIDHRPLEPEAAAEVEVKDLQEGAMPMEKRVALPKLLLQ